MSRLFCLLLGLLAHVVSAGIHRHGLKNSIHRDDLLHAENYALTGIGIPPEHTIEVPVDHFDPTDNRSYKNHYWVNDTWYEPGGPVFLYDAGEGSVSNGTVLVILAEFVGPSAPMALARKYNGVAIVWEHRFYGQSLPFELNTTTGVAHAGLDAYKFLDNEQALEDVVYFANRFTPTSPRLRKHHKMLQPSKTPWVFIGGSYPGARAAMSRIRNPETWYAAWASSAPVQAEIDMAVYFKPIEKAMPKNCSIDMHLAVQYADYVLRNGSKEQVHELRHAIYMLDQQTLFRANAHRTTSPKATSAANMQLWDIANILSYSLSGTSIDYQSNGFQISLQPFCNYLEQYVPGYGNLQSPHSILHNPRNATATNIGIAATYNNSVAFEALLSATYQKMVDDNRTPSYPYDLGDGMSWTWQFCSQFGYFQDTNQTDPLNLISAFDNVTSFEYFECQSQLPFAPKKPDTHSINDIYGGWYMQPSNVMFSNGEMDPWRTLGVQSDLDINPSAYSRISTKSVPPCNQPPPRNEVFGQIYPGQVHAQDLIKRNNVNRTEPAPFDLGFDLFSKALDVWFPCFGTHQGQQTHKQKVIGLP